MTVYLVCLDRPLCETTKDGRQTRHYVGWVEDQLLRRLERHAAGRPARGSRVLDDGSVRSYSYSTSGGSVLLAWANERQIGWELVRTWPRATRAVERWIKRSGARYRFCPRCNPASARRSGLRIVSPEYGVLFERRRLIRPRLHFRSDPA